MDTVCGPVVVSFVIIWADTVNEPDCDAVAGEFDSEIPPTLRLFEIKLTPAGKPYP